MSIFSSLWQSTILQSATDGQFKIPLDVVVSSISIDTRTLEKGAAFFALSGENHNGHDFVLKALEQGASLAVIEKGQATRFPENAPLLLVDDVLEALQNAAEWRRNENHGARIAVTGSAGKTSTKETLKLVLSSFGETHASVASYNNHWGVPLTLSRMPQTAKFSVFEVGMNHPFEIIPLTKLVRPHVAIITTIEPVHLAYFKSKDAIADAKGEIFSGIEPGGVAIINADNPFCARLCAHAYASPVGRVLRFGAADNSDIKLLDCELLAQSSKVRASVLGKEVSYTIGAPGRHFVQNSLSILGVLHALGKDIATGSEIFAKFDALDGRGKQTTLKIGNNETFTLIDESYNANPASMRAAIAVLGSAVCGNGGRRIAILGDMLELGKEEDVLHAQLEEAIMENDIDLVFAAGSRVKSLYNALPSRKRGGYSEEAEGIIPMLAREIKGDDVLMIKSSFGAKMRLVAAYIKDNFAHSK